MATQNFQRTLLILYKEGKKNLTLVVCFLLLLHREIKNVCHLQHSSSVWRPLAFLPVTLSKGLHLNYLPRCVKRKKMITLVHSGLVI